MTEVNKAIDFFKRGLYNQTINKKSLLTVLKKDYDPTTIIKVINALGSHPYIKKFFFGNPSPQKISQLGDCSFTYTGELKKEIFLWCFYFTKFSPILNLFLEKKSQFENQLLLGNYTDAKKTLDTIKDKFGYSIWLIENTFIVEEQLGGIKANKEFLNHINKNTDNVFVTTIAHYYSLKAEAKTSAINYFNKLGTFKNDLKGGVNEYLSFKLNYLHEIDNIENLTEILSYESIFSLIDRYLTVIKMAQLIASDNRFSKYRTSIAEALTQLSGKLNHLELKTILLSYGLSDVFFDNKNDRSILDLYEEYTIGDYSSCILKTKKIIPVKPTEISLIELYTKSFLHKKKEVDFIGLNKDSFLYQIIDNIYKVLYRNESSSAALNNLMKLVIFFDNNSVGPQLMAFIRKYSSDSEDEVFETLRYLNGEIENPVAYKIFLNKSRSLDFLNTLNNNGSYSVVKLFRLFNTIVKEKEMAGIENSTTPLERQMFYKGKILRRMGKFEQARIIFEEILKTENIPAFTYEECLLELLSCLLSLNNNQEYINLYVNSYFKNEILTSRANFKNIHELMEIDKFQALAPDIYLSIFYRITNQNNHITNVSIRRFLKHTKIKKPSELDRISGTYNQNLIIYFLSKVCTQEVLKYFPFFQSTKEILDERLTICQSLISSDKKNQDLYNTEIGNIVQNLVILEGIQQVDESKIYVDVKSLRSTELKETKDNFIRYIEISDLISNVSLFFIDLISNKKILLNIPINKYDEDDYDKAKLTKSIKFELFKEIFYEVKNGFLFNNKYGLDSYLSTRIRHGTLLGQIRSPFQDQYLITQKDKEKEIYFENEYWKNKLNYLTDAKQAAIQEYLSDFSLKIDNLTTKLKDEYIQIRTNDQNIAGLFDYTFPGKTIDYFFELTFQYVSEYEIFLDAAFKILWDQTSLNLEIIRQYISNTIKDQFISFLDELETNLKSLKIESIEFQELLTHIINCRTNIAYELDKISNWFQIKEVSIKDFHMDKVIETSLEITNRFSHETKISQTNKCINSNTLIKGEYFINLFDLFRVFFENIVEHSKLQTQDLKCIINVNEINDFINVGIVNNLNESIDKDALSNKLKQKQFDLNMSNWDMEKVKKETDSGFYKAKKILANDLHNDSNTFNFCINTDQNIEITATISLNEIKA